MFTPVFWRSTAERAISTAAQSAIAVLGADTLLDSFNAPWQYVASVAAGGAVLSVLKSLVASQVGDKGSPSLIRDGE